MKRKQIQNIAISYIRFSTPEQLKGDSTRRQLAKSQAWCERNGYLLESKTYRDLGISGFTGDNVTMGKLGAFIKAVDDGHVKPGTVLIIESLDRLTRQQVPDALELFLGILRRKIIIVTLQPEDRFDRATLNEIQLIVVIVILSRAYNESSTKSDRVGDAWAQKKLNARAGHKVTARCPGWLRLDKTKQSFTFVPEKVKAVRRLIELSNSGIGINSICKKLNQENQPTLMNHAKHWHASSVLKTLTNRALFGEYQPRFSNKRMSQIHRKADGDPIPDYYPPLISQDDFYALQAGLQARRTIAGFGKGRQSNKVVFLFPKLLKDAETGASIERLDKGKKSTPCLISTNVRAGKQERQTFPYEEFEAMFLLRLKEISLEELSTAKQRSAAKARHATLKGKISEVSSKLRKLKAAIVDEEDVDDLVDVIKDLTRKLKELKAEEQTLMAEVARNDPTSGATDLLRLVETATGEDLYQLRSKLRLLLSELIEVIKIKMYKEDKKRVLEAEINFRNGFVRRMRMLAYVVYTGGGSSNPRPQLITTSYSTDPEKRRSRG